MKKFIPIYILITLVVAVLSAVITSNIPAVQSLLSGTTLYTPEMVKQAEEDAYNKGAKDKETLLLEVAGYKSSLEKVTADKTALQETLALKQSEIDNLKAQGKADSEDIAKLEAEKLELQTQIADLEYTIEYYEQLLEAYQNIEKMKVTYQVNSSIYDVQLVNENEYTTEPAEPKVDGYIFKGWSLDGSTIVDVDSVVISEDTTFFAVLVESHTVTYVSKGSVVHSEELEVNTVSTYSNIPTLSGWSFSGWSTTTSKEDIVDVSSLVVTEDITLNAIFNRSVYIPASNGNLAMTVSGDATFLYQVFTMDFSNYCGVNNLINSGYEYSVDLYFKHTNDYGTAEFNLEIIKSQQIFNLDSQPIGGYFPVVLTADNKLLLNTEDGSSPFLSIGKSTNRFEITDIQIYTY